MRRDSLLGELGAEFFGTFILILLGDGVVANVGLAPRLGSAAYSWDMISFGWAFAVVIAVYVAGGVTGAHINPAVTIALAVNRGFPWSKVGPYVVAQVAGAFVGAFAVWATYYDGLVAAGMPNVWCTSPGSVFSQAYWGSAGSFAAGAVGHYSVLNACITEFFGTMVLLWGVMASGDQRNLGLQRNMGPFLVGFTVLAVGLSLGGPSGYAINPARDFGPRVFGTLVGTPDLFKGLYWLFPPFIVAGLSGAVGVFFYDVFITPFLPKVEE